MCGQPLVGNADAGEHSRTNFPALVALGVWDECSIFIKIDIPASAAMFSAFGPVRICAVVRPSF
jgi:hypothetical protein